MRCSFDSSSSSSSLSMASLDPVDRGARGQLRHAALSRVGASKAQAALAKIIAIITAAPPCPSPDSIRCGGDGDHELKGGGTTGRVDLRLRLGLPPEIAGGSAGGNHRATGGPGEWACALATSGSGKMASEAGRSFSPAISAAPCGGGDALTGSRSSEGECDPPEIENGEESREEIAEGNGGAAETGTTVFNSSSAINSRTRSRAGYLDLLLEAVRQVSGVAFDDDDDAPAADKSKREAAAAVDEEDQHPPAPPGAKRTKEAGEYWTQLDVYEEAETAPIVRSKRGRSQALPSRYRDSILDPWRKPAAVARHGWAARARP
ncbi:uncharacterized protein LOC141812007 [Curcuma longa]|uniref:uncharacterized protein LOC141812007 n=1 Tax=Curcuma longa TaxID=136217 RepID=UPI003D9E7A5F